ncbi:putative ribosomal protein L19 [Helianthus annuus]|uniref:Ribosomal protein L19 n=1 Tax=Helianthus annuus TaxID=4232 RepID=A0A251T914_HELAN|nr:50S ribosomal protein L19-2, chloroplastic [Helianthus annuus]KAF5759677.1 putative ribosomal protein L19 [Helianthus annuus]KAJ0437839.1 putative ribosomal protein L19 [Helianthus annuus]KAJ0442405.1 putative ribosomal protein L19 [Helianthus annuus]KAJ0460164.1 putative ribosomal protein L19 [Helianthus annuus]KAJ0644531.1 putative ribosomal protein L19 [Helianthus annuus]
MASIAVPQALYMIPTKFQSKRLAAVSSFLPPFHSASASSGCRFTSGIRNRNSFVVRAEPEAEAASVAAAAEEAAEDEALKEEEEVVEEKPPKKPIVKLGDIMGILNKQAIEASDTSRPVPDLRTGDIVEIKLEVPENRRRLSIYKGIVISKQNAGIHTTIRIRRIIAGVGVEIVFPIYSPNIKEIKVVKHRKVRRARLYYLRDKLPRLSTFK